jgi:hypothetical protein
MKTTLVTTMCLTCRQSMHGRASFSALQADQGLKHCTEGIWASADINNHFFITYRKQSHL